MQRTKPVRKSAHGSGNRAKADKWRATWEHGKFQESSDGTFSYTTQVLWRNPRTGCRMLTSIGVVVSEGSVMMWLKT